MEKLGSSPQRNNANQKFTGIQEEYKTYKAGVGYMPFTLHLSSLLLLRGFH